MKTDYKQVENYVIGSLNREYLADVSGFNCSDNTNAFMALRDCFKSEYGYNLGRGKSNQEVFADYLSGLPSCLDIAFSNYAILKLAKAWGSLAQDATERQEDRILEKWFSFVSRQYIKATRKHGVDLF